MVNVSPIPCEINDELDVANLVGDKICNNDFDVDFTLQYRVGDKVLMISAINDPKERDGRIINLDNHFIYADISAMPGDSGSPLIHDGKVIGMVIEYIDEEGKIVGSKATRLDSVDKKCLE